MRERYPAFARGWQRGRTIWGKGGEHIATFIYGMIFVTVLFPLGAFLACLTMGASPAIWCFVLLVIYGCGMLVRRMQKGRLSP